MRLSVRALAPLCAFVAFACSGEDPPGLDCPLGTTFTNGMCVPDKQDRDGGVVDGNRDAGFRDGGPQVIDAGFNAATISAADVMFGRTVIGDAPTQEVQITNNTAEALTIKTGTVTGSAEIAMTAAPNIPADGLELAPGANVTLTFSFTPSDTGSELATVAVELCTGGCPGTITITGDGIREAIVCTPPTLDFGLVNPGQCLTLTESCENDSSYPADIISADLSPSSSPAYTVTGTAAFPATLQAGDTAALDVMFCPTDLTQESGVLQLEVTHPDPMQRTKSISLVGVGGGPNINCTGTALFGIIGTGQTATRNLSCANDGPDPLTISAADFAAGTTGELTAQLFVAGSTVAAPVVLNNGESVDITLTYAPQTAGAHVTTFDIASDDRDTPTVSVSVEAEAIDSMGCTIAIEPAALEFGAVPPGTTARASTTVTNTGTGLCAVTVVGLAPGSDTEFGLTMPGQGMVLNAGQSLLVEATFTPSAEAAFTATLDLQTTDLMAPNPTVALSGTGLSPFGAIQTNPQSIDFGAVAVGCVNIARRTITVSNFTGAAATVTVSIDAGTPNVFSVLTMPATVVIPNGGSADVELGFLPGAIQPYAGRVRVEAMGLPPTFVSVTGSGSNQPMNTETFPGRTPRLHDVLFIVDDSCSMAAEQARLADAAPIFIARGDAAGSQYHMAVVTTDPTPAVRGTIRGGVIDWMSATRVEDLTANITQGTGGSGNEQGLRAARDAVTVPALLNGTNAGFLRANGELTVIAISDEEDSSQLAVSTYLTQMANRPTGMPGSLRVFTITGGTQGCQGGGTTAAPSQRYPSAATQTGGFDASICAADYEAVITQIADNTFDLVRDRFQLGSPPAPGTVAVRVNGTIVPTDTGTVSNWGVDYSTGEIVFAPGRAPLPTATVEIDYTGVCTPGTCGNGMPDGGEQCDDGNADNTDMCIDTCYTAACGDGFVLTGVETCDDGNTIVGDGCNFLCGIEACGNGILEPPEECDLGMAMNSDTAPNTCRTACLEPSCGDNVTDTGEQCDDGNADDTDDCVQCATAFCGDGFVRAGVEECDDGNMDPNDLCNNQCENTFGTFTVTSTPNVALMPLTGGTALAFAPNLDDGIATVPIGFAFDFAGETPVTDVAVSTNGFISFEAAAPASANQNLPNPNAPNTLIAWWWDDLDLRPPLNTPVVAETSLVGTAPNRVRVFTLLNIPRFRGGNPQPFRGTTVNAEIRLYEGTNVIEVHYGARNVAGGGWGASAGWEAVGGVAGQNILGCTTNCSNAAWPTNTVYVYTPD